jgi:ppGpp synthetase/RelA/SpoT-type nucleotidyltranferase
MSEFEDIEAARAAYAQVRLLYKRLATQIRHILETKLAEAGLTPVSITHRPKAIESFAAKITRKHYNDPLSQMTDLAGVRVVCAYESELAKVAEIIEASFEVRERIDKAQDLGVDRMGYNGKAFVVTLGTRYAGGVYENITALACEIQVRTILQDAWAIIDHQLVYKNEESTPERLRRDLNNVASLLEIAQGIFDSVKEKRVAYVSELNSYLALLMSVEQIIVVLFLVWYGYRTVWYYPLVLAAIGFPMTFVLTTIERAIKLHRSAWAISISGVLFVPVLLYLMMSDHCCPVNTRTDSIG